MEEDYDEIDRECAVLEAIYWDCTILKTHHANKVHPKINFHKFDQNKKLISNYYLK